MKSALWRQKRKNKRLLKENHFQVKACKMHTQKNEHDGTNWGTLLWHKNSTISFSRHIWLKSTEVSQTSADHTVFSCRGFKVFSANKDIQKIKSQPRAFPLLLLFAWRRAQHTEQTQPSAGSCWAPERVQGTSLLTSRTHHCQPSPACPAQALRITKTLDANQVFKRFYNMQRERRKWRK